MGWAYINLLSMCTERLEISLAIVVDDFFFFKQGVFDLLKFLIINITFVLAIVIHLLYFIMVVSVLNLYIKYTNFKYF